ncbi:MAG: SDR family oxidoreductase [Flavobacteriales bacterium]|nr:SDR family oxidoreductase [Flavobacteriales bacterium]MBS4039994.1 SDR family oxidoreductase [Flavobacteriales bacterium]
MHSKRIWITGATSGIGLELAKQLISNNFLILSGRSLQKLQKVAKDFPTDSVALVPLDLSQYQEANNWVEQAWKAFGGIDIMIHNAGISQRSLIIETDILVDKALMETNYLGTVALTKALLPKMIASGGGQFVVVTSLMGKFGSPYRSGYCGSKHALHGFFDVLRMEHEKDGISVTMICPGFVQTNIAKNALTGDGSTQNTQDEATENGLEVGVFAQKMIKAIKQQKMEAYIGQKEVMGIWLKRFFPKLLHRVVLKSKVR